MKTARLPIAQLREAPWNPNCMEPAMAERLRASIQRYGLVQPLVVRPLGEGAYEVLSGNQRLKALTDLGFSEVPCVLVEASDPQALLLAQALNRIHGEDDLGLRAEALRRVLEALPEDEVLAVLPETAGSLQALAALGKQGLAEQLEAWQAAQAARLKHLLFHLSPAQLEVVQEALERVLPRARAERNGHPNARGTALFLLCQEYLRREGV